MAREKQQTKKENYKVSSEELLAEVEEGADFLTTEHLAKLDADELKEILQYLDPEADEKRYNLVYDTLQGLQAERISKVKLGHRIWSFHYEKWMVRIALLIWILFGWFGLRSIFPSQLVLSPTASVGYGTLGLIVGVVLIVLGFHVYLGLKESSAAGRLSTLKARHELGIYVLTRDGSPLGFWRAFLRGWMRAIPLGVIMLISLEISQGDRGLHDKLFGTYVLRLNGSVSQSEIASFIAENYD